MTALAGCGTTPSTAASTKAACDSYKTAVTHVVDALNQLYKSGQRPTAGTHAAVQADRATIDHAATSAGGTTGDAMRKSSAVLAVIDDKLYTWRDSPVDISTDTTALGDSIPAVEKGCGTRL